MPAGKNVLVIQQTREILEILSGSRYKIMDARDCIAGVRSAIRYRPDIVITEFDVPNLTGISMARILKILQVEVPVILTSFSEKHREPSLAQENVAGFILTTTPPSDEAKNNLRTEFEAITRKLQTYEPKEARFRYRFRQHEWANLLGISGRKRILVVEDNESFRTILLRVLDQTDRYDLFSAGDGLEGVLKALLVEPDLILTDIVMPVLDGMAMSQMFNVLDKPFPLVILTAREDAKLREKARKAAGIRDYLSKEILRDKTGFIAKIEQILEKGAADS